MERNHPILHRFFWAGVLLISAGCNGAVVEDPADPGPSNGSEVAQTWNFDGLQVGKLPDGWKVEATGSKGALASWQVVADSQAPSPNHVLALTEINHGSQSTFNLCWTSEIIFLDGEISVQFKTNTGEVDQGGGLIWRAIDADNYYIARFNPLEDNFRVYTVKNGVRRQLATVKIQLDASKWHSMKIVQEGDHYQAFLNGKKLLEGNDSTFQAAGGIGLWTKADAVTSFDSLSLTEI
jgi:3-keto-disaccharide hydrolase